MLSSIPANWEEIANMRLALLDKDYQECIGTNIKTDPEDFKGLAEVLKEVDVEKTAKNIEDSSSESSEHS